MEVNSREEMFRMIEQGNPNKPKTVNQQVCEVCQEKKYRVLVKGVERWMGCKCATAKPFKKFIPK
jgi:hypothetical protein